MRHNDHAACTEQATTYWSGRFNPKTMDRMIEWFRHPKASVP